MNFIAIDENGEQLHLLPGVGAGFSSSSPLAAKSKTPSYEMKFLLTEAQAQEVAEQLNDSQPSEPDRTLGSGYRTTTVYCDTAHLNAFHRTGPGKRLKHRVRRYGDHETILLERKSRKRDRVRTRCCIIGCDELHRLAMPVVEEEWAGHWFHTQLLERSLAPVCRITYDRVALVGHCAEGPLQVTFDRNLRGVLTVDWDMGAVDDGISVLPERVICEFRYRGFAPALFKSIIQTMALPPVSISKYRTFLRATDLPAERTDADAAMA